MPSGKLVKGVGGLRTQGGARYRIKVVIRSSSDHNAATMEPTMLALRAILLTALAIAPCFATAGLAEWEIKTPGGNLIFHVEPFIAANRTCFRSAWPYTNYVAHLESWRYLSIPMVGHTKTG